MQNSSPKLDPEPGLLAFLRNWPLLLIFTIVAFAFRIWFLRFQVLTDDSFLYGDMAKNWMLHGIYGLTMANGPEPNWIRLPGYPAIIAIIWKFAGLEHYHAILYTQIAVDVLTCFFVADIARRIAGSWAAKFAFALCALCPFFANYAVIALTETWAIFFGAVALDMAIAAFDDPETKGKWLGCGLALAGGILLRPDGGILLVAIGLFLIWRLIVSFEPHVRGQVFTGGVILLVVSLAPLVPWTIRNWRVFHQFQPLTPLYANNPDEYVPQGFHRWMRTWSVDYVSVDDIWFKVPGDEVKITDIPARAFDSDEQERATEAAFAKYNENPALMNAEIDAPFAKIAADRVQHSRFRYYVEMPVLRALDLWLRPRTELLPLDTHWWRWHDDPHDSAWSIALGVLNLFYVLAALVGVLRGPRYLSLLLLFVLIRTAFLSWMPNPEPRYVLECFPVLLATAAVGIRPRK